MSMNEMESKIRELRQLQANESVALDGKRRGKQRRQEIEIYYSFVGKVDLPNG